MGRKRRVPIDAKPISTRLPLELHTQLEKIADKKNNACKCFISKNDIIREALIDYVVNWQMKYDEARRTN